ncbi:acylneuraminate cytidylyltransferase family protein [Roseibium suaedae]|uniref:N-acylneuraminate cytidylyltransferase/CMP-N,N'-diacetyllegionaminic acid synthase n=1 Tax=Roseibium suaedae TaxID=735517 RepID=A0A1M7D4L8_9HYPH|nr:acylneuraminate cytidylyltransferase family protein [Roseibium suaedae]SHL74472.1 N-acylneuraminate cytidylyltransferase/CMP-N,N'-diacetyllegionaminic acid synthase [Roseibium suaedae]
MTCVAIVPARGGSKGVPGKNLKQLAGRPLIAWTIEAAKSVAGIDDVIVSTDDEQIAETARSWGATVPFERPSDLAQDHVHAIHVVLHAIDWLEQQGRTPDAVMMLLPTAPLRRSWHIENALSAYQQDPSKPVISVYHLTTSMISLRWIEGETLVPAFPADDLNIQRQDVKPIYGVNGSIYIASPQHLKQHRTYHTPDARAFVMDRLHSMDINSYDDFTIAQHLMQSPDVDLDRSLLNPEEY